MHVEKFQAVKFGTYVLHDRIGAGGMAEIFLATAPGIEGFQKELVIKRILPSLSDDEQFVKMFIEEARLCAHLRHPNIVQVYDLGAIESRYFIAMEYVHGRDLLKTLAGCAKKRIGFPTELALYIVMEVLKGLDYAHNLKGPDGHHLGIIHRDVSPSNVLLSFSGEVKIGDFGIAKASTREKTATGILKGKFGYMAPEQVVGAKIDHRADVFATGILLYELLTGHRLFAGRNDLAVLERVRDAVIDPPPRHYRPDLSVELEAIVLRALARDTRLRFQSTSELHDALYDYTCRSNVVVGPRMLARFLHELFLSEETEDGFVPAAQDARPSTRGPSRAEHTANQRMAEPSYARAFDSLNSDPAISVDSGQVQYVTSARPKAQVLGATPVLAVTPQRTGGEFDDESTRGSDVRQKVVEGSARPRAKLGPSEKSARPAPAAPLDSRRPRSPVKALDGALPPLHPRAPAAPSMRADPGKAADPAKDEPWNETTRQSEDEESEVSVAPVAPSVARGGSVASELRAIKRQQEENHPTDLDLDETREENAQQHPRIVDRGAPTPYGGVPVLTIPEPRQASFDPVEDVTDDGELPARPALSVQISSPLSRRERSTARARHAERAVSEIRASDLLDQETDDLEEADAEDLIELSPDAYDTSARGPAVPGRPASSVAKTGARAQSASDAPTGAEARRSIEELLKSEETDALDGERLRRELKVAAAEAEVAARALDEKKRAEIKDPARDARAKSTRSPSLTDPQRIAEIVALADSIAADSVSAAGVDVKTISVVDLGDDAENEKATNTYTDPSGEIQQAAIEALRIAERSASRTAADEDEVGEETLSVPDAQGKVLEAVESIAKAHAAARQPGKPLAGIPLPAGPMSQQPNAAAKGATPLPALAAAKGATPLPAPAAAKAAAPAPKQEPPPTLADALVPPAVQFAISETTSADPPPGQTGANGKTKTPASAPTPGTGEISKTRRPSIVRRARPVLFAAGDTPVKEPPRAAPPAREVSPKGPETKSAADTKSVGSKAESPAEGTHARPQIHDATKEHQVEQHKDPHQKAEDGAPKIRRAAARRPSVARASTAGELPKRRVATRASLSVVNPAPEAAKLLDEVTSNEQPAAEVASAKPAEPPKTDDGALWRAAITPESSPSNIARATTNLGRLDRSPSETSGPGATRRIPEPSPRTVHSTSPLGKTRSGSSGVEAVLDEAAQIEAEIQAIKAESLIEAPEATANGDLAGVFDAEESEAEVGRKKKSSPVADPARHDSRKRFASASVVLFDDSEETVNHVEAHPPAVPSPQRPQARPATAAPIGPGRLDDSAAADLFGVLSVLDKEPPVNLEAARSFDPEEEMSLEQTAAEEDVDPRVSLIRRNEDRGEAPRGQTTGLRQQIIAPSVAAEMRAEEERLLARKEAQREPPQPITRQGQPANLDWEATGNTDSPGGRTPHGSPAQDSDDPTEAAEGGLSGMIRAYSARVEPPSAAPKRQTSYEIDFDEKSGPTHNEPSHSGAARAIFQKSGLYAGDNKSGANATPVIYDEETPAAREFEEETPAALFEEQRLSQVPRSMPPAPPPPDDDDEPFTGEVSSGELEFDDRLDAAKSPALVDDAFEISIPSAALRVGAKGDAPFERARPEPREDSSARDHQQARRHDEDDDHNVKHAPELSPRAEKRLRAAVERVRPVRETNRAPTPAPARRNAPPAQESRQHLDGVPSPLPKKPSNPPPRASDPPRGTPVRASRPPPRPAQIVAPLSPLGPSLSAPIRTYWTTNRVAIALAIPALALLGVVLVLWLRKPAAPAIPIAPVTKTTPLASGRTPAEAQASAAATAPAKTAKPPAPPEPKKAAAPDKAAVAAAIPSPKTTPTPASTLALAPPLPAERARAVGRRLSKVGELKVECPLTAEVTIVSQGTFTADLLLRPFRLQPGDYRVRVKNAGGASYERSVKVLAGETTPFKCD